MSKKNNKKNLKRNTRNIKIIKYIKISTVICFLILICELVYVCYNIFYNNTKPLYFDGVNSFIVKNDSYITVGSNNNNDNYYEKAKFSIFNKKKEKTFEKLYNVGYNSVYFGLVSDSDDNIITVGSYENTLKQHEKAVRKALIVKYDKNGDILFERNFSKLDNSKYTSIYILDDYYYVTGQSVYSSTKVGNKDGGAILNKYDKNGDLIWSKTYGSNKSAIFNDLIIIDNYIYTVGADDNHLGIICKYDLDGNLIGYNDYKTTDEIGFSGIEYIDDYIYICGANKVSVNDTDAMIVKYNLDCDYISQVVYKGKGIDRFNKLVKDKNNNIIAIGNMTTKRNNKHNTYDDYDYDGIIGKYSVDLEKIQVVNYGDESDDYFTGIQVVDNTYLVAGYSSYEDGSYLSKFISYSEALKILEVG